MDNSKQPHKFKSISKHNNQNEKSGKSYQHNLKQYHKSNSRYHNNRQNQDRKVSNDSKVIQESHQWDFDELAIHYPALDEYVFMNEKGRTTIDWSNPKAHKTLNQAILAVQFKINYWDMPQDQLIPAIPSRLNYLEWIQKKLAELNILNTKTQCKGVDIGTGASMIYPLLGYTKYNWKFIATEISQESLQNAQKIVQNNQQLQDKVEIRKSEGSIFKDIILQSDGKIAFSMCNPPFFSDHQEKKMWMNVQMKDTEYICEGGEFKFLQQMFEESKLFSNQISLFTSLVGRQTDYEQFVKYLKSENEKKIMQQNEEQSLDGGVQLKQELEKVLKLQIFEGSIIQGHTTRWIVGWKFT